MSGVSLVIGIAGPALGGIFGEFLEQTSKGIAATAKTASKTPVSKFSNSLDTLPCAANNIANPATTAWKLPSNRKAALYTERELLSAAKRLKIPNVKVTYVEDLLQTDGAYGLYRNGQIFVQKGLDPEITKGIIRHEYGHTIYEQFSSWLSSLYFTSGLAKVGEEAIVHAFAVGSVSKGLVLSIRYIDHLFFRDLGIIGGAGVIIYEWWTNE